MTLGLLDLSIVTDRLIAQLRTYTSASQLWSEDMAPSFAINYTGLAPDAARSEAGCQVSVYLMHVAADKFYRNTYPTGGSAQTVPQQPLALTLYYLLTAYSKTSYNQEQQAMSIALKWFHENPIVRATVPIDSRVEEFTVTLEPHSLDEMGRLWQGLSSPWRLSAIYRASVVFVEPAPRQPEKFVRHFPHRRFADVPPTPPVPTVTASSTGSLTITIADASLIAGEIELQIRAMPLQETTTAPPGFGQFRFVDASNLEVTLPQNTPSGVYLLTLRPSAASPTREIWLDVP